MREPFLSIVLPTFNRGHMISRAIESVLKQDFGGWELLIIDDGSTDNTKEVVARYRDKRIKYHWQKNAERSTARNNGVLISQGKYICYLDSDDWYEPSHLAILRLAIESSKYEKAVWISQIARKKAHGKERVPVFKKMYLNDIDNVLVQSVMTSRLCIHKEVAMEFPFNSSIRIGEDKELLVRIASKYPILVVPDWTVVFEEHAGRTVNEKGDKNLKANIKLVKQLTGKFPIISKEAKQRALADAWYNLGRHYATKRSLVEAFLAFGRYPLFRLKRKIHLLAKGS